MQNCACHPVILASLTGHPVGGVCLFANPPGTRIHLNESLRWFDVVYPATGSIHSAIGITLVEPERFSDAIAWADLTRRLAE